MAQTERKINFDTPVITVKGLETKYDLISLSLSLAKALRSYEEAFIVQILHFGIHEGKGIVIDGETWFDTSSLEEWVYEVIPFSATWKMHKHITSLVNKGVLERKPIREEPHGRKKSPKKRLYSYRLDYERLSELPNVEIPAQNLNNAGGVE